MIEPTLPLPVTLIDKCQYYLLHHRYDKDRGKLKEAQEWLDLFDKAYDSCTDIQKEVVDTFIERWELTYDE